MFSLLSQVQQKIWIWSLAVTLPSSPSAALPGPPRLIYCSQNFTGILGRVWPFQITPGNADIISSCQEVKTNTFGYFFKINRRCCGAADFPKLFQILSNFPTTAKYICQKTAPALKRPSIVLHSGIYSKCPKVLQNIIRWQRVAPKTRKNVDRNVEISL